MFRIDALENQERYEAILDESGKRPVTGCCTDHVWATGFYFLVEDTRDAFVCTA